MCVAAELREDHGEAQTYPVIITLSSLGSIILVTIILVIIYKKCNSFRDIIITKGAVAKSNSYKSSLGGNGFSWTGLCLIKQQYSHNVLLPSAYLSAYVLFLVTLE